MLFSIFWGVFVLCLSGYILSMYLEYYDRELIAGLFLIGAVATLWIKGSSLIPGGVEDDRFIIMFLGSFSVIFLAKFIYNAIEHEKLPRVLGLAGIPLSVIFACIFSLMS